MKAQRVALCGLAILWLAACGASDERYVYSGQVLDVRGRPLPGVEVRLCRSCWGWQKGVPVMDKLSCSTPAVSGIDGRYRLRFGFSKGFIKASRAGWRLTRDEAQVAGTEKRFRMTDVLTRPWPQKAGCASGETDRACFCRLGLPEALPVDLTFEGTRLRLYPLLGVSANRARLAASGSLGPLEALAKDMRLTDFGGRAVEGFAVVASGCGGSVHVLEAPWEDGMLNGAVEWALPTLSARLPLKIWRLPQEGP